MKEEEVEIVTVTEEMPSWVAYLHASDLGIDGERVAALTAEPL